MYVHTDIWYVRMYGYAQHWELHKNAAKIESSTSMYVHTHMYISCINTAENGMNYITKQ